MKFYLQSLYGTICVLNEVRTLYAHPYFCDLLIDDSLRMDDAEFTAALKDTELRWIPVPTGASFPYNVMATAILKK